MCHLADIVELDMWKGRQRCRNPRVPCCGAQGDGFLVLALLLLDLQDRDGDTQMSCPTDHTLVIGQDCDHLRVCSIWAVLRSSTVAIPD